MSHRIAASITRAAAAAGSSTLVAARRIAPSSSVANGASGRYSSSPSSVSSSRARGYCSPGGGGGGGLTNLSNYLSRRSSPAAAVRPPAAHRAISGTPRCPQDATPEECPAWQNPIHHGRPAAPIFSEDFDPGDEMPLVPLPPFESADDPDAVLAGPHLHELAEEITRLNMVEMIELVNRVGDHFDLGENDYVDEGGGAAAAVEEVVEEKTIFDLKLTGFDAKSKIKVIKQIRGMTTLGLKEAKELVEGAPTTVKKDIKMEEAEELKAKLEEVGGIVEIV